jgi:hypothetical protein
MLATFVLERKHFLTAHSFFVERHNPSLFLANAIGHFHQKEHVI